jgi:hypothetical protein
MLHIVESTKTLARVITDLEQAVARHKFGVLGVHDLKAKLAEKGVPFGPECRIFEVCNPHQAKKVLEAHLEVSTAPSEGDLRAREDPRGGPGRGLRAGEERCRRRGPGEAVWGLNVAVPAIFTFSFTQARTACDWCRFGRVTALVVALFTEMPDVPLGDPNGGPSRLKGVALVRFSTRYRSASGLPS